MSDCTTPPLLLLLILLLHTVQVSCSSGIEPCPTYQYFYNGSCHPCPKTCKVCVSGSECTICEKGFYGHACESTCTKYCTCHKTYGYCTEGCPDKEYPEEGNGCEPCPGQCSLCDSVSKCFACDDGFYGEICQYTCPDHCSKCNISTGICLECTESYYLLYGTCKSCAYTCMSCISDTNCTKCHNPFWSNDGHCESCPHGCSMCIAEENCQSCEHGYYGPINGTCIFECLDSDVRSYFLPDKHGRCGLWQNTDNNLCDGKSNCRSCTSRGNCIHDVGNCTSDNCVTGTNIQGRCGKVMQYNCLHTCARIRSRYGCEYECAVKGIPSRNTSIVCLANDALNVSQTFQNQIDCSQEDVTPTDSTSWPTDRIVLIVCAIVCAITTCILIALISQRTCRRGFKKRNTSREDFRLKDFTRPDNRTQAHVLSAACPGDDQPTEPMLPMDTVLNISVDEGFEGSRQQSRSQSVSTTVSSSGR